MKKLKFRRKSKNGKKDRENQRLALLAKELGVATMMVLVNDYRFTQDQANEAMEKIIKQAEENRLMIISPRTLTFFLDIQNIEK
jgi:hypothetical protein